ncbi:MAG TPA: tyrosine-type recombinase/integrase [Rudaea sp.]|jgi:integrase
MNTADASHARREPWNKGKLVGQKAPLRLRDIWAIRIRIQLADNVRDLALFNLAIDSKLRACDLVTLRVRDIAHGDYISQRAIILQQKTQRPVQFEITEPTRVSVAQWMKHAALQSESYLFPTRQHASPHLSTRQYARIVSGWIAENRLGCGGSWHAHDAQDQGVSYLSAHQEPAGGSTTAGAQQIGEHCEVSWHRGR